VLSKLEILSQVLLSLRNDQNDAMNNINALLNNNTKEGLIGRLKDEIGRLALIHASMQETQSFIVHLSKETLENEIDKEGGKETKEE